MNTSSITSTAFPCTSACFDSANAPLVLPALAASTCLDAWLVVCATANAGQPERQQFGSCVSGYLAGLVEPAFPLALDATVRNQPVSLKALTLRFIGAGEPRRQRAREARMPAILELVNDFFDRVLEGSPSTRDIEAIQVSAASPAERRFAGDGF